MVLSDHNRFVGKFPGRDNSAFAAYYGCSVVAVRRRGEAEATSGLPPALTRSASNPGSAATLASRAVLADDPDQVQVESGISMLKSAFEGDVDSTSPAARGRDTASGAGAHPPPRTATSPVHDTNPGPSPTTARTASYTANGGGQSISPANILRGIRTRSAGTEEVSGVEVAERKFKAGDVILVLAEEEFMDKFASRKDFFLMTKVGSVPKPVRPFDYLPLLAFVAMLIMVLMDIEMVRERESERERLMGVAVFFFNL